MNENKKSGTIQYYYSNISQKQDEQNDGVRIYI